MFVFFVAYCHRMNCCCCCYCFATTSVVVDAAAAADAAFVPSFIYVYLVPVGCYFYRCLHWLMAVTEKTFFRCARFCSSQTLRRPTRDLVIFVLLLLLTVLLFAQNNNYVGGNSRACTSTWRCIVHNGSVCMGKQ